MLRVWRRRLLGGVGVAAIVPVLLVASLGVLAVAGGFGGLSALGQAFSGPAVPASVLGGGQGGQVSRPLPPRLVAALSSVPAAPRSASGAVRAPATSGGGPRATPGPPVSSAPPARGRPPAQSPAGGSPHVTTPAPTPQPTLVDKVVGAGTSVTSQLPGPAGPAATKTLQAAGSTLDSIAPIKSP
jgi:type IV secretion system protein TrbL